MIAATHAAEIREEMKTTHRIPKILLGHDLVALGSRAGFQTATDDEYALTFLSRYGTWAGRYPIPLRNADYGLTETLSNGNHYLTGGYNPEHVSRG